MIDRIGCLSYVPLGYGTPQIQYLLRSLHKYYGSTQPCGVITPSWSNYPDIDNSFPDFFVHRLPQTGFWNFDLHDQVENLIRYCRHQNLKRIAFYGAGSHTKQLLALWVELSGPPITRLLVTKCDGVNEFCGVPMSSVDEIDSSELDIVVLSSAKFESDMSQTLLRLHPALPFLAIYNENLSHFGKLSKLKRESLINLDHYAAWIDAFEPDILVCTHYTYLDAIVKAKHTPQAIFYYCFEHPEGTDGSALTDADRIAHEKIKKQITLALYPEAGRMHRYQSMFGFEEVPSALMLNSRPLSCSFPLPWNQRNGRILVQGSLSVGRTFVEYLPQPRSSAIWIDAAGQNYDHAATRQILEDEERGVEHHYRFLGFLNNKVLSDKRRSYAYSLVMWNPTTFDALHACPNKFFEAIADAVPPICAPHPQCREIVERYDCGILMKDWSFDSYSQALWEAQTIFGTNRYRQLVENCQIAQRDICWESQFDTIKQHLPAQSRRIASQKPKFILVDPTLQTEIGHHLVYAENVLQPARSLGYETVAAINRSFCIKICGVDRLQPLFSNDFWGRDTSKSEKPLVADASEHFIQAVSRLLESEMPADRDHIFVPNISDADLQKLADFLSSAEEALRLSWHIVLRHDLPSDSTIRAAAIQRLWRISSARIFFYTDTLELSEQHSSATGVPFTTLPIPVVPDFQASGFSAFDSAFPLTVSYVGDARREKGFCVLPQLVQSSIDLMDSGKVRFSIQCNTPSPDPDCKSAIHILQEISLNYPVQLITNPLSKHAYDRCVHNADVILALYDPPSYARRSSHVVMEALTSGKAVLITKGTSPGALLPNDCPWLVPTQEEAAERLHWIIHNYDQSRKLATKFQDAYAHSQTGAELLKQLLTASSGEASIQCAVAAAGSF